MLGFTETSETMVVLGGVVGGRLQSCSVFCNTVLLCPFVTFCVLRVYIILWPPDASCEVCILQAATQTVHDCTKLLNLAQPLLNFSVHISLTCLHFPIFSPQRHKKWPRTIPRPQDRQWEDELTQLRQEALKERFDAASTLDQARLKRRELESMSREKSVLSGLN